MNNFMKTPEFDQEVKEFQQSIINRVTVLMELHNTNGKALAALVGMTQSALSKVLRGETTLSLTHILAFSKAFHVPVEGLLKEMKTPVTPVTSKPKKTKVVAKEPTLVLKPEFVHQPNTEPSTEKHDIAVKQPGPTGNECGNFSDFAKQMLQATIRTIAADAAGVAQRTGLPEKLIKEALENRFETWTDEIFTGVVTRVDEVERQQTNERLDREIMAVPSGREPIVVKRVTPESLRKISVTPKEGTWEEKTLGEKGDYLSIAMSKISKSAPVIAATLSIPVIPVLSLLDGDHTFLNHDSADGIKLKIDNLISRLRNNLQSWPEGNDRREMSEVLVKTNPNPFDFEERRKLKAMCVQFGLEFRVVGKSEQEMAEIMSISLTTLRAILLGDVSELSLQRMEAISAVMNYQVKAARHQEVGNVFNEIKLLISRLKLTSDELSILFMNGKKISKALFDSVAVLESSLQLRDVLASLKYYDRNPEALQRKLEEHKEKVEAEKAAKPTPAVKPKEVEVVKTKGLASLKKAIEAAKEAQARPELPDLPKWDKGFLEQAKAVRPDETKGGLRIHRLIFPENRRLFNRISSSTKHIHRVTGIPEDLVIGSFNHNNKLSHTDMLAINMYLKTVEHLLPN